jgi:translation initiation factor 1 (eIF-1/SUI1)
MYLTMTVQTSKTGKVQTIIDGIPPQQQRDALSGLQKRLGVGGAILRADEHSYPYVMLQGDQKQKCKKLLKQKGHHVDCELSANQKCLVFEKQRKAQSSS